MAVEGDGAGAGEEDGQDGNGAPSKDGSPEGGSDNDKEFVPASRLKAALATQKQHHDREMQALRDQLNALTAGLQQSKGQQQERREEPKRYTKAQLKAAVEAGTISQDQADEVWDTQIRTEAVELAQRTAAEVVDRKTQKERIDTEIGSYKRLKPEIMQQGSEIREKIAAEFNYLVGLGHPGSGEAALPTQLAAIRAVLGPIEKLEKASGARRVAESDEQGGGTSNEGKAPKTGKALVDKLDSRYREHYEKAIKQGRYKDWTDVEAELKLAPPRTRARMGLPA